MNTLQDLRATLDQHAASVEDLARHDLPAAVRQRVRDVRRRRAAAVAIAAVVVLVAALSVTGLVIRDHGAVQPAGVLDVDVPAQVRISGTAYVLDEVREVTPGSRVPLATTDQLAAGERLAVSLVATGLGSGRATLLGIGEPLTRLVGDDPLSPPVTTQDGTLASAVVEVEEAPADAQVALAVYRPASTELFPADLGDRVLVAQDFAEPGDSAAEVRVDGSGEDLHVVTYCTTDGLGLEVSSEIDGAFSGGSDCDRYPQNALTGTTDDFPDGRHTVRAVLTRGVLTDPTSVETGTVLGVAVYRWTERRDVLGSRVPETVEYAGRRWVLDEVRDQQQPGETLSATVDTAATVDGERLLGYVTRGGADVSWAGRLVAPAYDSFPAMGSVAYVRTAGVLLAGDRYAVTATPQTEQGETALLVYRPE